MQRCMTCLGKNLFSSVLILRYVLNLFPPITLLSLNSNLCQKSKYLFNAKVTTHMQHWESNGHYIIPDAKSYEIFERVSDCCLSPKEQFFSQITARTSYFRWDYLFTVGILFPNKSQKYEKHWWLKSNKNTEIMQISFLFLRVVAVPTWVSSTIYLQNL
jgi:hypothetical protein